MNSHLLQQCFHVLPHLHFLPFHHQNVHRTHRFVSRIHEKLRRRDSSYAFHRTNRFFHALPQRLLSFGDTVKQDTRRMIHQREYGQQNENGDDERADRIGDPQTVFLILNNLADSHLNQKGGQNHADRSQRIRQHMQKHTVHVIVLPLIPFYINSTCSCPCEWPCE